MKTVLATFLVLISPLPVAAAIVINEVAWMGSLSSPNHEWIELYNSGASTDVTGWTLSDGNNLTITLADMIAAGQYAVLERTSDDSAPGPAFLIYTGALTNSGATLTLRRTDGSIADQVAGGEGWANIGGNNTNKHTAQYTTSGWVTASPTPGASNAAFTESTSAPPPATNPTPTTTAPATNPTPTPTTAATQRLSSGSSANSEPLVLPGVTLKLDVFAPFVGYVHQPIDFTVVPTGVGNTLKSSLSYDWNFGDGSVGAESGTELTHTFLYPGRYVVSVYGSFARQYAEGRHEITILPVALSLTRNGAGDAQISNDAPYEIDISGYVLEGNRRFVMPPRTYLLPQYTLTIPSQRIGDTTKLTLHDAMNAVVARHDAFQITTVVTPEQYQVQDFSYTPTVPVVRPSPAPTAVSAAQFGFTTTATTTEELVEDTDNEPLVITPPGAEPTSPATPFPWPYLGLAVLILGAAGLLLVQPRRTRGSSNTHD